jgi:GH24 family phage-related lysozyme (muramidase)
MAGAAEEFLKYTIGGGKVLKGLVNRRNDEKALFLN